MEVQESIASYVKEILSKPSNSERINSLLTKVDILIYKIFEVSYDEIISFDPEFCML